MPSTSVNLLKRLTELEDESAWRRFVHLYTPLIFYWARQRGLSATDASDLVQEVFVVLVKELPKFQYDPSRSFRAWLRQIVISKATDRFRSKPTYQSGEDPTQIVAPADNLFEKNEYHSFLSSRAMQMMKAEFSETHWKACWEHVALGRSAAEVAAEFQMSEVNVRVVSCRVLKRLREEFSPIIE